jgi:hypothetical protein
MLLLGCAFHSFKKLRKVPDLLIGGFFSSFKEDTFVLII